jgi:hypothetical protein
MKLWDVLSGSLAALSCLGLVKSLAAAPEIKPVKIEGGYAVVVSEATATNAQWRAVVQALVKKYGAKVVLYSGSVPEARAELARLLPRYACFVARPEEAGRPFVINVQRLTRQLDDDPYTDVIWGILTGYRAEDALRIASCSEPLVVRKGAGGTGIPLQAVEEGVWYDEGRKNHMVEKTKDGKVEDKTCPDDTTQALVDVFNKYKPDFFITSGHATEHDWQIGYSYRNGQFRCRDGVLLGVDTKNVGHEIRSPNPKIYLPFGNCLMGHIDGKEAMALAFMGSGGVNQMCGYTVSTWFGYGGWGIRDYFFGQPGRFTLAESFFCNMQALVHELETRFPDKARQNFTEFALERDPQLIGRMAAKLGYTKFDEATKENLGLLWDRDTVAFYGDPAWEARLVQRDLPWSQTFTEKNGIFTFELVASQDASAGRPPMALFPSRLKNIQLLEGKEYAPVVKGNFLLLGQPRKFQKGQSCKVVFKADRVPPVSSF